MKDNLRVNKTRPSYYTTGNSDTPKSEVYEPLKIIRAYNLNFARGNALKYILRAGKKQDGSESILETEIKDLRKAIEYLKREIEFLEPEKNQETSDLLIDKCKSNKFLYENFLIKNLNHNSIPNSDGVLTNIKELVLLEYSDDKLVISRDKNIINSTESYTLIYRQDTTKDSMDTFEYRESFEQVIELIDYYIKSEKNQW
jgi:hypothetical protein